MRVAPAALLALALVVAGCGGEGEDEASPEVESTSTASSPSSEETASEDPVPSERIAAHPGAQGSTTVSDLSATSLGSGYAEAFPDETGKELTCDEGLEPQLGAETECTLKGEDDTWGVELIVSDRDGDESEVTYLVSMQRTPIITVP